MFYRLGRAGYTQVMSDCWRVANFFADGVEKTGAFKIWSARAPDPGAGRKVGEGLASAALPPTPPKSPAVPPHHTQNQLKTPQNQLPRHVDVKVGHEVGIVYVVVISR